MKKLKLLIIICFVIILIPIGINLYVVINNEPNIYNEINIEKKYDIALVLGCSVLKNGSPSKMLRDRLNAAIKLYEKEKIEKILISGDHTKTYSEIDVMNKYLLDNNVKEEDILFDYKGYSTNESLLNYNNKYSDKSVIIVTQKYHLYRALFIAKELNLNAIGVHAELINYGGQTFREIREILARNKDFALFKILKRTNNWN